MVLAVFRGHHEAASSFDARHKIGLCGPYSVLWDSILKLTRYSENAA